MSRLIDIDELADYLKLKKQTIYNWLNQRKISGIKVGGVWRFDRKDIDNWLRSKKRESAAPSSPTQGDGS
jgi:excisionase family DNA binding protein